MTGIKVPKEQYEAIVAGKMNFFCLNISKPIHIPQPGNEVWLVEYDDENKEETDRRINCTVTHTVDSQEFGMPPGYLIFTFHTTRQQDFIRDFDRIVNKILPQYEEKLSHVRAGDLIDRIDHVLSEHQSISTNSIWKAKQFVEDVKTQFKALELVVEGITGHGNHSEKRVLANHVINLLRTNIDRIDKIDWEYSTGIFERYNFFRSQSPERTLLEKYRDVKSELDQIKAQIESKKNNGEDLPF